MHLIFFILYGIAGLVVGFAFSDAVPYVGEGAAPFAGISVFVVFGFIHFGVLLRSANRRVRKLFSDHGDQDPDLESRVAALERAYQKLKKKYDARDQKDGRVVQEMQVLQGLVAQLNAKKAGQGIADNAAPIAQSTAPAAPVKKKKSGDRKGDMQSTSIVTSTDKLRGTFPTVQVIKNISEEKALEITRDALAANRIDLYLQPIVQLPQRKVRYFETFSRIRDTSGHLILPEHYVPVAIKAGLLTTIDNLLLFRCIHLIRNVQKDAVDVGFFYNLSTHSMNDKVFFTQFVEYMEFNKDLAGTLIFELNEVDLAAAEVDSNLQRLSELGFTFSLDHVTKVGIDYEALAHHGFRFIKLDSKAMLQQFRKGKGVVDSRDLHEAMSRAGISLIADKIESEKTLIELLEYNIGFGQGFLFGEPRISRESAA